jgi:putative restriction endonuclease
VTSFVVGERYTRDQVRAAAGLRPMAGGDWATGYARVGNEVFVFCNIGVAGRTGHDYPNRWVDDALDWFGKTGSSINQPMINGMIAGALTTHVFWRG